MDNTTINLDTHVLLCVHRLLVLWSQSLEGVSLVAGYLRNYLPACLLSPEVVAPFDICTRRVPTLGNT